MRVLVSVDGVVGREVRRELEARGVTLVPSPDRLAAGDVVVLGCDDASDPTALDEARRALERAGVARLVLSASWSNARGRRDALQRWLATVRVPHVAIWTAPIVGRDADTPAVRALGAPILLASPAAPPLRFVHVEDVVRVLVDAATGEAVGSIELAPEDSLRPEEVAAALGRRVVRVPAVAGTVAPPDARLLDRFAAPGDRATDRATDRAGTDRAAAECAWSSRGALEDLGRATRRSVTCLGHARPLPWRLDWVPTDLPAAIPPADGGPLEHAAPPERRGSLDDPIDPRFPTYTAANLGEAFPGPMTPMSLELNLRMLRGGGDGTVHYLGLREPVATELRARAVCSFGHRLYGNVSVLREMAKSMPGWTPEDIDEQYLGIPKPSGSTDRPGPGDLARLVRLAARVGPRQLGHHREVDRVVAEARREEHTAAPAHDDARLAARIALVRDLSIQAWHASTQGNVFAGGVLAALERTGGPEIVAQLRSGAEDLTSAAAVVGVRELARRARREPEVGRILDQEPPGEAWRTLSTRDDEFARRLRAVLADVGHRGPGETELANPVFADRPELLVDAVAKAARGDEPPDPRPPAALPARLRPLAALAMRHVRDRERARDAAMRLHHSLRRLLRERGRRLAAAGGLDDPEDVFFLTAAEEHVPPPDARARVEARRAERERLAALVMPAIFEREWEPVDDVQEAVEVGETLEGIAAASGRARGTVRVLADASSFDLEPGEVLVARTTDTGWTPLFAFAAAVVTDIGGMASHPAIVAREYGIPAVVNAGAASTRLCDGMTVEVDGRAGTVTRVE